MKNSKKGFIVPLLVTIIILLTIGGGYYYLQNKNLQNQIYQNKVAESNVSSTSKNNSISSSPTPNISIEQNTYKGIFFVSEGTFMVSGTTTIAKNSTLSFNIGGYSKPIFTKLITIDAGGFWSILVSNIPDGSYPLEIYQNDNGPCDGGGCEILFARAVLNVGNSSTSVSSTTIIGFNVKEIFDSSNIFTIVDYSTNKEWSVNYQDAKYYDSWIDAGVVNEREGNLNTFIDRVKASLTDLSGRPGNITVTGIITGTSSIKATKISQHQQ